MEFKTSWESGPHPVTSVNSGFEEEKISNFCPKFSRTVPRSCSLAVSATRQLCSKLLFVLTSRGGSCQLSFKEVWDDFQKLFPFFFSQKLFVIFPHNYGAFFVSCRHKIFGAYQSTETFVCPNLVNLPSEFTREIRTCKTRRK